MVSVPLSCPSRGIRITRVFLRSPISDIQIGAASLDGNGNPRPITFPFAGLQFQIPTGATTRARYYASDQGFFAYNKQFAIFDVTATAPFPGGSLTLYFPVIYLDPI